jgi:hypothetical protein
MKTTSKDTPLKNPQPMQPVIKDEGGTLRFRENAVIRYIVDHAGDVVHPGAPAIDPGTGRPYHQGRLDLGKLMTLDFPQEDREQFAQLMGYALTGYHELSYVSDESAAQANALAHAVETTAVQCTAERSLHPSDLNPIELAVWGAEYVRVRADRSAGSFPVLRADDIAAAVEEANRAVGDIRRLRWSCS